MKHYAIFIDGVRGGTITFPNTQYGEELKDELMKLAPRISLALVDEKHDVFIKEHSGSVANSRSYGSIGGEIIRGMISQFETNFNETRR